jgi:hypothetical protein
MHAKACLSLRKSHQAASGMNVATERLVRKRAAGRCEYFRLPQSWSRVPFEFDHIIPRKHRGGTVAGNLALGCNRHCDAASVSLFIPQNQRSAALCPAVPREHLGITNVVC